MVCGVRMPLDVRDHLRSSELIFEMKSDEAAQNRVTDALIQYSSLKEPIHLLFENLVRLARLILV